MLSLFSTLPTLDRVFDDVMRESFAFAGGPTPSVEVRTEDSRVVLELDVPGVKPDDLSVEVEGKLLYVSGKRNGMSFERAWTLPEGLDTENLKASLDYGVLTIEIPKHPKAMPRKVSILTASERGSTAPKQLVEENK